MNVGEMMGKVMVALDEVTSFDLTANLEDYRYKIYEAIDSTQEELATMVSPIFKTVKITVENGYITLPEDMYELISILEENYNKADYTMITPEIIRIADGEYYIMYNKHPAKISGTITDVDEMELEISREAQEAMIYGVCALLCVNDEPDLYNTYMSRYIAYMTNIINRREQKPKATVRGGVSV